jgi:hypothetical protein
MKDGLHIGVDEMELFIKMEVIFATAFYSIYE